ncbi:hypothetical protein RVS70_05270 [Virgibacillus sp. M23]|uniref:hypothetical protein n=1 Tax=Virgibacillus sp. M23 TaxID=3079030 RepID=UPI002A908EFC|nr:hypothetical protein [Virgibacillus sp. M23]MDY7043611.1 hypothetical protein [Virgibacillus sp. M23]
MSKIIKCYYCGKVIETENQLVEKKIPMATKVGIRNYRRKFHMNCLPKYLEGRADKSLLTKENNDWNAVYNYFRKELLGLGETKSLDTHTVRRLTGLRLGQYYPNGQNVRILPRGYDFKTILLTMKVVKPKVNMYVSNTNFSNSKHRTDGIMRFITGEINDVSQRIEQQNKASEKLMKDKDIPSFDYKAKLKEKKQEQGNTVQNDINNLFGGQL